MAMNQTKALILIIPFNNNMESIDQEKRQELLERKLV